MNQEPLEKYNFKKYIHKKRWVSYWHQINEVLDLNPVNILEIGVGNKTVSNFLKKQGLDVTTLDINESLGPDIVGSVLDMPFDDNSFDVILCAEVLEHLPFQRFDEALRELRRVSKKFIVLSLPHFSHPIKVSVKVPLMEEKKFSLRVPWPVKHEFDGEHFWQIGKKGYSLSKIKDRLTKYFKIKKEFVPFEKQSHHFFVLEKVE